MKKRIQMQNNEEKGGMFFDFLFEKKDDFFSNTLPNSKEFFSF